MRVKTSNIRAKRHKKILKSAKGYRGSRSKLTRVAKEAVLHAGQYAFSGRRQRKNQKRRLWIIRLNAALKNFDLSYSQFINKLKTAKIELDRKVLADIAANDQETFKKIVSKLKTL